MNNLMRRHFMGGKKAADPTENFIITVNIANNGDSFTLPLAAPQNQGNYDFIVDWGDGISDEITVENQAETTHVYTNSGNYDINMNGIIEAFNFATTVNSTDKLQLLNIKQWGGLNGVKFYQPSAFDGCLNLNITATDNPNFTNLTNGQAFFRNCTSLIGNSSFDNWDVSTIENFTTMFNGCSVFNAPIGNWNMSNATNIFRMLRNTSFDQDLSTWNVSAITNAGDFLAGVTLSTLNYDALLIGWESQAVQNNVPFHAGNSQYTAGSAAATARQNLITDHSWSITDGGSI